MNPIVSRIQRWAAGLRMPKLLALIATLFVVDLVVPDVIPLIDELLLGLGTLVLSNWRKKPPIDVTPKG
jgi:hypothetical protein